MTRARATAIFGLALVATAFYVRPSTEIQRDERAARLTVTSWRGEPSRGCAPMTRESLAAMAETDHESSVQFAAAPASFGASAQPRKTR